jgi:hypothetical protein
MGKEHEKSHWPAEVEEIAFDDIGRMGVHRKTNELYWDGKPVKTKQKVSFSLLERIIGLLASLGVVSLAVFSALRYFD